MKGPENTGATLRYDVVSMRSIFTSLFRAALTLIALLALPSWGQVKEITCYSDVFAPYVIVEGKEIRGIDVDTISEAGRRVGIKVHFQVLPWVRLERDIALGAASNVDCAFAYTMTDARRALMDFTTVPVKLTELSFFAKRGTLESYKKLEDMSGKTVGIRRGFKLPAAMQTLVEKGSIKLEEVNGDGQNFEKLARGRLHAILSNRDVGVDTLAHMGVTDIVALSPSLQITPTYMVFNKAKGLSALVPLFDQGFKSLETDGTYRRIRARYR